MLPRNTQAPDFTLPDAHSNAVSLHDYRGTTVVLVFYPKDNSLVCTRQLNEYALHYKEFTERDAEILAVSTDHVDSHENFRITCHFPFPLLSDEKKDVCRTYDVLSFFGKALRAVYIIDTDGMIRYAGKTFPLWYLRAGTLLQEIPS